MRLSPQYFLAIVCALSIFVTRTDSAAAQTATADVKLALESLHDWIGGGEKGEGWRRYLKTDELEQQLEKGSHADRLAVQAVLDRYSSDVEGLEMRRFLAVRRTLEAWLKELPPLAADQLATAAREARGNFASKGAEDVRQARQQLDSAIAELDRLMAKWVSKTRADWQDYLDWQVMKDELNAASPDLKKLQGISDKYFQNHEGLELPRFIAVRHALRNYADVSLFASNAKAQEYYEKYMDQLAERLDAYTQKPTAEDAVMIGQIAGWMHRFGQAPELVSAVRHYFSRPNLFVQLSEDMLRTGIETDIEEDTQAREVILGTTMYSNGTMKGRVGIDLIPSEETAALDLLLSGTIHSNNTGYNGPVTIYSTGVTTLDARKRIEVDAEGITLRSARASCRTSSRVNNIAARSQLIKTIAWNKTRQSKSRAEAIAAGRAERRVAGKMDSEVAELLAPTKEMFFEKFRYPLVRRGGFPEVFALRTTEDRLFIKALEAAPDQLAAPDEPPALTADHDVAVQVHQSLVGNLSQALLGGVTLSDERMALLSERLTGEIPEALEITQDSDPWSITFANERPLDARFDDHQLTMMIRAKRFMRRDQELKENVEVSAIYDVEKTARGTRMTRKGDVNVVFGEGKRLTVGDVAMKTFVRKKFEDLFKEKFESDGVALPGRWQAAGKMRLDQLHCDDGWLVFGWYQPPADARTARR